MLGMGHAVPSAPSPRATMSLPPPAPPAPIPAPLPAVPAPLLSTFVGVSGKLEREIGIILAEEGITVEVVLADVISFYIVDADDGWYQGWLQEVFFLSHHPLNRT